METERIESLFYVMPAIMLCLSAVCQPSCTSLRTASHGVGRLAMNRHSHRQWQCDFQAALHKRNAKRLVTPLCDCLSQLPATSLNNAATGTHFRIDQGYSPRLLIISTSYEYNFTFLEFVFCLVKIRLPPPSISSFLSILYHNYHNPSILCFHPLNTMIIRSQGLTASYGRI